MSALVSVAAFITVQSLALRSMYEAVMHR